VKWQLGHDSVRMQVDLPRSGGRPRHSNVGTGGVQVAGTKPPYPPQFRIDAVRSRLCSFFRIGSAMRVYSKLAAQGTILPK